MPAHLYYYYYYISFKTNEQQHFHPQFFIAWCVYGSLPGCIHILLEFSLSNPHLFPPVFLCNKFYEVCACVHMHPLII